MTLDYITLENNIDYAVVDTLIVNDNKYLFLANENDEQDFTVRKVVSKDNQEYIRKLDSNEEFDNIMDVFFNKHKKEISNEE